MQTFKRYATVEYIKMVKLGVLPPFDGQIWQRNYWENIVRNENEYYHIAQYIKDNPRKWAMDKLNGGAGNQVMEPPAVYGCMLSNHIKEEPWMV